MCIIIVCVFFSLFVPCHAHSSALCSLLCGRMQSEVTQASFFYISVHIFSCNDGSLSHSKIIILPLYLFPLTICLESVISITKNSIMQFLHKVGVFVITP